MILERRGFLRGLGGLAVSALAAPAIVRASSLMAVQAFDEFEFSGFQSIIPTGQLITNHSIYLELAAITRRAFVPRLHVQIYESTPLLNQLMQANA